MKQKNIPWIGAFIDSLFTCLPFLGIINFVFISIVLYNSIQPYLLTYIPWVKLWMFLLLLLFLVIGMMFFIYKFVLPSLWTFRAKQMYGFDEEVLKGQKIGKKESDNED